MIENLTRPWLLGRFVVGFSTSGVALLALAVALAALARPTLRRGSEAVLAEEKRIELVSTLFSLAGSFAWLDLVLAVLGADRLAGSIRGAMCAYGVLASSPWGFRSLALAVLAALTASGWRALHAVDLTQREPVLTRTKLIGACLVAPLVVGSFVASTAFALDLDFRVVASCCSTGFASGPDAVLRRNGAGEPEAMAVMLVSAACSTLASLLVVRAGRGRRARSLAVLAAVAGFVAAAMAIPAIVGYVAPHAYETPVHQCPFCLLSTEEGGGLGWPLYGALGVAVGASVSLLVTAVSTAALREPELSWPLLRRFALRTAVGWLFAMALALYPVLRFAHQSGGASLFG